MNIALKEKIMVYSCIYIYISTNLQTCIIHIFNIDLHETNINKIRTVKSINDIK